MNDIKFSVLMSVYVNENPTYFQDCLESVMENTVKPDEIVIIEDGPLNESLYNIIKRYESMHKNIVRYSLKENVGLGKALSIGVNACSHNLIARMDTDDICVPERFKLQLEEFIKDRNLVLVGSYIDEFDDDPQQVKLTRTVPLVQSDIEKYAKRRNPFNHMTVMFKKDIVVKVGNYRKVYDIGYEDYDLWIRLLNAQYKVRNIEKSTVKVRTGDAMLKRRGNKKRLLTALHFRKIMKKIGYINYYEYLLYCFLTILFSYSPSSIKAIIYKTMLRKS